MLQAHSLLWHYLWVAPNVLLLVLAFLMWRRGLLRQFPAFFALIVVGAIGHLALYVADVIPSVTAKTFWLVDWASLLTEGPLKFVVVGEIFANVFGSYVSLARLGKLLIGVFGVLLVLASAVAAAYSPGDSLFGIVSGVHLLEQTIYLIESGLLVFILALAGYFHLTAQRRVFGIALGLGISACVHLGTWAILANGGLPASKRGIFDFVNMFTNHVCVLIWCYYLLVAPKVKQPPTPPAGPPALQLQEQDLENLNEELERLLHQ